MGTMEREELVKERSVKNLGNVVCGGQGSKSFRKEESPVFTTAGGLRTVSTEGEDSWSSVP